MCDYEHNVMNTIRLIGHMISLVSLLIIIRRLADELVVTLSPKLLAQVSYK